MSTQSLFPEKKKPKKHIKKAINLKQLAAKKFVTVDLGEYSALFGNMEGRCLIMAYGPSNSGKSTFVLSLANYLANKYGKTLYDSHEEGTNLTMKERAGMLENPSPKLYLTEALSHQERLERIKRLKYRCVVIDSVQYAKLTYEQLIEMRAAFSKRNIIFILVSFGSTLGKTDAADRLLFASDIKIHISLGRLTCFSRYSGKVTYRVLFNPNEKKRELIFQTEPEIKSEDVTLASLGDETNGKPKGIMAGVFTNGTEGHTA